MADEPLVRELRALGDGQVLHLPEDLLAYEYDD